MVMRCDCCDLPVESCGRTAEKRARNADANARQQALGQYGWFRAQFGGTCVRCQSHFEPGDPISWTPEGYISYCCTG